LTWRVTGKSGGQVIIYASAKVRLFTSAPVHLHAKFKPLLHRTT